MVGKTIYNKSRQSFDKAKKTQCPRCKGQKVVDLLEKLIKEQEQESIYKNVGHPALH